MSVGGRSLTLTGITGLPEVLPGSDLAALLIGALSGLASVIGTMLVINGLFGGVPFPIAFFPKFRVPGASLWWGPAIGGLTALAGSFLPAWSARSVKVSEVFSRIS